MFHANKLHLETSNGARSLGLNSISNEVKEYLVNTFKRNQNPTIQDIDKMSSDLLLSREEIVNWFRLSRVKENTSKKGENIYKRKYKSYRRFHFSQPKYEPI